MIARILSSPKRSRAVIAWIVAGLALTAAVVRADDTAGANKRLLELVKFLASDALEGRGLETPGINTAADYLAGQFSALGLKTDLYDGKAFQKFTVTVGGKLTAPNTLMFSAPSGAQPARQMKLELGKDFTPLVNGGSGKFSLDLALVGYGITGRDKKYDDYAGIDIKGKAVIILRNHPQQDNPHSMFKLPGYAEQAAMVRKISNAYEHGAAAVILCRDAYHVQGDRDRLQKMWNTAADKLVADHARLKSLPKDAADQRRRVEQAIEQHAQDITTYAKQISQVDPLLAFDALETESDSRDFPILYCRRDAIDELLQAALNISLAQWEKQVDEKLVPQSRLLGGWRAVGQTSVERRSVETKNVVAVLEGKGPHADETIVIGAHYDHLGWGGRNSLATGVREIHNGADDNASGSAALVEIARQLKARKRPLGRRVVFIAFTGEERGLLGSAYYVRNPLFALDKTIAMLNMDMVGRMQNNKLIVNGTGTGSSLEGLVDRLGKQLGVHVVKSAPGYGPSDHSSFYAKRVPVLHFFTGSHSDYHRPSDDYEKLNIDGMRLTAQFVAGIAEQVAQAETPPKYAETNSPMLAAGGDRPYFGSIPDFSQDQPGYALTGVTKGGPAERAGIRGGDIIVRLGESRIGNLEDFDSALRKHKAGEKVAVLLKRGGKEKTIEVTLDPPRQ